MWNFASAVLDTTDHHRSFTQITDNSVTQVQFTGGMNLGEFVLTPSLYCMGPKVSEPKKWLVPNFIFKGWEWCI